MTGTLRTAFERVGKTRREFRCCDTEFVVSVVGVGAGTAAASARETVETLESQLDAFDPESVVSQLYRNGAVRNEHVARIVRRGLEYHERTDHAFDIRHGQVEGALKAYLRGDSQSLPDRFDPGAITVEGDHVSTDSRLDLNGLAKGYIVDRAAARLAGLGRRGFVSGGGDMSPPTGPIAIESPYGDGPLKTLDTDWSVATSGGYRQTRNGTDHVYDPRSERLGSRHESVTVLARRDCMEADALATTLAALPLDAAQSLASDWEGVEALIIHDGVFHPTDEFEAHVLDA